MRKLLFCRQHKGVLLAEKQLTYLRKAEDICRAIDSHALKVFIGVYFMSVVTYFYAQNSNYSTEFARQLENAMLTIYMWHVIFCYNESGICCDASSAKNKISYDFIFTSWKSIEVHLQQQK